MRAEAEGRALHHRDALLLEERGDEILVVADACGRRSSSCPSSPRRTGRRRRRPPGAGTRCPCAWFSIETTRSRRWRKISAFFGMKSCGPVSASSAAYCEIERRVGGRLRLDRRHRLDERLRAAAIADAPAGHGIGLRHAVDGERALDQRRLDLGEGREDEAVIDEVLVHVVGHHPDMRMPHAARRRAPAARPRV